MGSITRVFGCSMTYILYPWVEAALTLSFFKLYTQWNPVITATNIEFLLYMFGKLIKSVPCVLLICRVCGFPARICADVSFCYSSLSFFLFVSSFIARRRFSLPNRQLLFLICIYFFRNFLCLIAAREQKQQKWRICEAEG